jgi:hypothetical protein
MLAVELYTDTGARTPDIPEASAQNEPNIQQSIQQLPTKRWR